MAFSSVQMFYLEKSSFKQSTQNALYLWGVYAFATVNLSMLSQALWQHGVLHVFFILALIFFYKYFNTRQLYLLFFMGVALGFAVITRPTALIPVALLLILLFVRLLKYVQVVRSFATHLVGYVLPLGFFAWYNQTYYQSISNQGYFAQATNSWLGNFPESFFGIWLSPSKGILVYSPVLVFSLVGLVLAVRSYKKEYKRNGFHLDYIIFGFIVLSYTLVMSKWKHWYGGYSYGYRMSSDILPFLVLLLIPYLSSELFKKTKKLFLILFGLSVGVQLLGLVFFDGIWHSAYDKGFVDTGWLWSLRNSEMAFNFRRVLVKFGFLQQACEKCLPSLTN